MEYNILGSSVLLKNELDIFGAIDYDVLVIALQKPVRSATGRVPAGTLFYLWRAVLC